MDIRCKREGGLGGEEIGVNSGIPPMQKVSNPCYAAVFIAMLQNGRETVAVVEIDRALEGFLPIGRKFVLSLDMCRNYQ